MKVYIDKYFDKVWTQFKKTEERQEEGARVREEHQIISKEKIVAEAQVRDEVSMSLLLNCNSLC